MQNIHDDPGSEFSRTDKSKIDQILHNIMQKRGICLLGQPREPEHPFRAAFSKFIRVAQHKIFNPDRPKITGMVFYFLFLEFGSFVAFMSFTGDDLLEYEKRLNSLAKVMQEISFDSLQSYDYEDPSPERTYSQDEIPLLSKRHQARVKKAEKKKDNKLDTLACRCYIYLLVICVLFEFIVCIMIIFTVTCTVNLR